MDLGGEGRVGGESRRENPESENPASTAVYEKHGRGSEGGTLERRLGGREGAERGAFSVKGLLFSASRILIYNIVIRLATLLVHFGI